MVTSQMNQAIFPSSAMSTEVHRGVHHMQPWSKPEWDVGPFIPEKAARQIGGPSAREPRISQVTTCSYSGGGKLKSPLDQVIQCKEKTLPDSQEVLLLYG